MGKGVADVLGQLGFLRNAGKLGLIVPQGMVYERRPPERSGFDQDATAGSLTLGLSVTRASVSRLI